MLFDKLIHLPNKIFFPLFKKDKTIYKQFQYYGYIHKTSNKNNNQLADEIYKNCEKINVENIINKNTLKNNKVYSLNIFEYLDKSTKDKIFNFFNNKEKIYKVSSMLGLKVKLRQVHLMINFFNENTFKNEGPKMYHRDSDSLQDQVKIFFLLNNLHNENGMFYFVTKDIIDENSKLPFEIDRQNKDLWNKWRNYDETILKYSKNSEDHSPIKKLKGKKGEMLYIDTGKIYHKGGYIEEQNTFRYMIQAVYTPILSLSNWNDNNFLLKIIQNKLISLRIKLRKTLR